MNEYRITVVLKDNPETIVFVHDFEDTDESLPTFSELYDLGEWDMIYQLETVWEHYDSDIHDLEFEVLT